MPLDGADNTDRTELGFETTITVTYNADKTSGLTSEEKFTVDSPVDVVEALRLAQMNSTDFIHFVDVSGEKVVLFLKFIRSLKVRTIAKNKKEKKIKK